MFNNPFGMVVAIVAIVMIANVLKARYRAGHGTTPADTGEARQLRQEIAQLKERISVLERVITDNHSSNSLEQEIEKLR
jgi:hypothetical protein